jgi:hypothetical protein
MFTLLGLGAALVIALVAVGGLIYALAVLAQERPRTKVQRQDAGDFEARITQEKRYQLLGAQRDRRE